MTAGLRMLYLAKFNAALPLFVDLYGIAYDTIAYGTIAHDMVSYYTIGM